MVIMKLFVTLPQFPGAGQNRWFLCRINKIKQFSFQFSQNNLKTSTNRFIVCFYYYFFNHQVFLRTPLLRCESAFSGRNFQPGSNYWLFAQSAGI